MTDGTASLMGGALSGVTTLTAGTVTDGTASLMGGALSGVTTLTAGTVTDGTISSISTGNNYRS